MGSSARNFVRISLTLTLLLCTWSLVRSPAAASQDSGEGAIFDQALKEAATELEQQKKEQVKAQKLLQDKQRSTRQFESMLARARQQHAKIKEWEKKNSKEWKIYATSIRHKKHLLVATTGFR
jgi:hypothetical protein